MLPHGRRPGDSHDKTDEMAMCRHDELQLQEAVDGVEAVGVACPEVHQQTKLPQQLVRVSMIRQLIQVEECRVNDLVTRQQIHRYFTCQVFMQCRTLFRNYSWVN